MANRLKNEAEQLKLGLVIKLAAPEIPQSQARVASFSDAATLAIRRQAINRVQRSGIFSVKNSKLYSHEESD